MLNTLGKVGCNGPDLPLADIVLFDLSLSLPLKVFKTRLLEKDFHTLIKVFRSPPQPMWDSHMGIGLHIENCYHKDLR